MLHPLPIYGLYSIQTITAMSGQKNTKRTMNAFSQEILGPLSGTVKIFFLLTGSENLSWLLSKLSELNRVWCSQHICR